MKIYSDEQVNKNYGAIVTSGMIQAFDGDALIKYSKRPIKITRRKYKLK